MINLNNGDNLMIPANDLLHLAMKSIQEDSLSKICGYLKEDTPELTFDLDKNNSIKFLFYINAVDAGPEIRWYLSNKNNINKSIYSIQEKEVDLFCQYGKLMTFSGIKEVSLKDTNVAFNFSIPSECGCHKVHTKFTFTFDCDIELWRFDIFRLSIPMKPLMSSFDILKVISPCANEILYFETDYSNYYGDIK